MFLFLMSQSQSISPVEPRAVIHEVRPTTLYCTARNKVRQSSLTAVKNFELPLRLDYCR
jgi:hypothetical protein